MKRFILTAIMTFAFGIGLTLLAATSSMAVHKGAGDLTCGGCHTMHNSQGSSNAGNTLQGPAGGAIVLLRGSVTSRAEIHNLCLQCHASNGSQSTTLHQPHGQTAPKVYIDGAQGRGNEPTNTQPQKFDLIGAGGDFSSVFTYAAGLVTLTTVPGVYDDAVVGLGRGHSLGMQNVVPPGSDSGDGTTGEGGAGNTINLSCTSCHDPHGRNVNQGSGNNINLYRMLKYSSAGPGVIVAGHDVSAQGDGMANPISGMQSWVGGISGLFGSGGNYNGSAAGAVTNNVWPILNPNNPVPGQMNVYSAGANFEGDQATGTSVSNFCAQCHGKWHESLNLNNSTDNGAGVGNPNRNSDWRRHPVKNLIENSGVNNNSGGGVPIIDTTNYNSGASVAYRLPVMLNTVPALGTGTYYDPTPGSGSGRVFCLSCHFPHGGPNNDILRWDYTSAVAAGAQTGNGIASNVGCQRCHNR